MHQTFYIDIDEEITSIVERLRNAKSGEIVIVVPKRALLIQSIVNLRLLKKEADSMGVSISIVTQDNLGKILVEKAGISYQTKIDEERGDFRAENDKIGENHFEKNEYQKMGPNFSNPGENRLDKIGSDSYFDADMASNIKRETINEVSVSSSKTSLEAGENQKNSEKITNKELVSDIASDIKMKRNYAGIDSTFPVLPADGSVPARGFSEARKDSTVSPKRFTPVENNLSEIRQNFQQNRSGDRKIDEFFSHSVQVSPAENDKNFKDANLSKKIRKTFWFFGIIVILVIIGAIAYFLVPKAELLLTINSIQNVQDIEIRGSANIQAVDYESEIIPLKLISETAEISRSIISSGDKSVSSKKARGTITIYNEFGPAGQPLVATTRFESEDGKIFRLEKGITVPGTTSVGGETKPGAIEAEVIADGAGEKYNIGPEKFTIPGFKDSKNDKYAKIYAKSTKLMTGGGSAGQGEQNKIILQEDINKAKNDILPELEASIKSKIKSSAGEGMVILDDAINTEEATFSLSNSAGEMADKFDIRAQIKGSALVFSETDLKNLAGKVMARSGNGKISINAASIKLTYGKADVDFKAGEILIKASGDSSSAVDIDLAKLKKDILGKSNSELETYLGSYSDIEKADVTYWPPFMNKTIPLYEKRVEVKVETSKK
jgi:hypothetical protein